MFHPIQTETGIKIVATAPKDTMLVEAPTTHHMKRKISSDQTERESNLTRMGLSQVGAKRL